MLKDILAQEKEAILKKWIDLIADTHPAGAKLLIDKDQFTNPIGFILPSATANIFDELLLGNTDSPKTIESLDAIIRTRAVQDFSAGEAVGFVFLLKQVIRRELGNRLGDKDTVKELLKLESEIDKLACQAFNVYAGCKEKIKTIRINEIKRERDNAQRLLERFLCKYGDQTETVSIGHNGSEVME